MCSSNLVITFLLLISFDSSIQGKLNLREINRKLAEMCYKNRDNYLKTRNVIKCNITYDVSCWPETEAEQIVVQPCPFLFFSPKDNISRRCDHQGKWLDMNITSCRRLSREEAVQKGKQFFNGLTDQKEGGDSGTHHDRVQQIYLAFSWMAFLILLPTFLIICVVMSRENERFNFHKNLILAFILRTVTLFIHYYGKLGEDNANQTTCNVLWMLNRYFAASEITWMLNEAIFLLKMLVYPLENDSFFCYYFMFGWGFSGFLTFCVYLPYAQFKLSRISNSCWVAYSQSHHMLVLYVPLTIMLVINFVVAVYVVYVLLRKLKNSNATHFNTFKKGAKATVILISLLGIIYLLTFYQSEHNKKYQYFVAAIYPFQGVLVCVFCVFVSSEFRETLRRRWIKWRYGQVIDSTPSSVETAERSRIKSVGENEASTNRVSRAVSRRDTTPKNLSKTYEPAPSTESTPSHINDERSQTSMLSCSSDLTKFRMTKVEPEPAIPLRINAAGPEDWCPPFYRASKAWEESQDSLKICNESRNRSESGDLIFKGRQLPLTVVKPSSSQLSVQTFEDELQLRQNLSEEGLGRETRELEESTGAVSTGSKTLTSSNDYSTNKGPVFSSLQPASDNELAKGHESNKSMDATLSRTVDLSTAPVNASAVNLPNGSEPPTKSTDSGLPVGSELSTEIFGPSCFRDVQAQHVKFSVGQLLWKKALHLARQRQTREHGESTEAVSGGSKPLSLQPDESNKSMDATLSRTVDLSKAPVNASAVNLPNGSEPPTKSTDSGLPVGSELSTEISSPGCFRNVQAQDANVSGGQLLWKKALHLGRQRQTSRRGSEMVQPTESGTKQMAQKHQGKYKRPDEYRLAWIASLLGEEQRPEKERDTA